MSEATEKMDLREAGERGARWLRVSLRPDARATENWSATPGGSCGTGSGSRACASLTNWIRQRG